VDVAKDLAAYQTLVVELSKHLYIKDHPERQRVPKGFGSAFELHLEKVEEGSTRPILLAVTAGLLALELNVSTYFEQARDLITECIAADGPLPPDFPKELLGHFNQVGRSLQEGESMELPSDTGKTATLNPARRKQLVLATEKVYDKEAELVGYIDEIDWGRPSFRLRLSDGSFVIVPAEEGFIKTAVPYAGSSRHQVVVKCVASYDSFDRLQKVIQVESNEIQPNYEIAAKLDMLASLEDGWLDTTGKAPSKSALVSITKMMVREYPKELILPAIVPIPDGNILLEWKQSGTPSVDVALSSMQADFHAFASDGSDIESTFHLKVDQDWKQFFAFLNEHIETVQA